MWPASVLQPGPKFDNFNPLLKRHAFKSIVCLINDLKAPRSSLSLPKLSLFVFASVVRNLSHHIRQFFLLSNWQEIPHDWDYQVPSSGSSSRQITVTLNFRVFFAVIEIEIIKSDEASRSPSSDLILKGASTLSVLQLRRNHLLRYADAVNC